MTAQPTTEPRRSPAEPARELRRVPIVECGEALVDPFTSCPGLLWDHPRWRYRRERLVRRSVAEMLARAVAALPDGYQLALVEGWRASQIQRRMHLAAYLRFRGEHPGWSEAQVRRLTNRFSAPMDRRAPPPHTTGGAVDLRLLTADGGEADVTSPYERFDRRSYRFAARGLTPTARAHRRILKEALESAGLTNYPSEYWHWSYGDQGWAYRSHLAHAIYGATEPPGWRLALEDDTEEPLERLPLRVL